MRKFETLLLLSPELSAENREGVLSTLTAVVEREQGVITNMDHWGMRDLAYPGAQTYARLLCAYGV